MARKRDFERDRERSRSRTGKSVEDDDLRSAEQLIADHRARSSWQRPASKEKQYPGAKARVRSRY